MEIGPIISGCTAALNAAKAITRHLRIHITMSALCSLEGKVGCPVKTRDGKTLYPIFVDLSDASHRITIHKIKASGEIYQAIGSGTDPNGFSLGRSYGSNQIECGETLSPRDYGKWFYFFIDGTNAQKIQIKFVFGWFSSATYTANIPAGN
ncbi:hypothetical protein [Parasutterella muris]|uniref:hypothetical protein n=1 Tax=Parasutterella muris TaxID=2565572 RepID=UPI002041E338|nr:hypothetical protein [Parasutterella muris]